MQTGCRLTSLRILVVDDEPDILQVCVDLVRSRRPGDHVRPARSMAEALAELERQPVDLVLTDYRMPGGDGLALAAEAARRSADLCCIMMTAYADADLAHRARDGGLIQAFVVKPFRPDDLLAVIGVVAEGGRDGPELAARFEGTLRGLGWPSGRSPDDARG